MLCFNKLTGECNTKKILKKKIVLWEKSLMQAYLNSYLIYVFSNKQLEYE